MCVSRSVLTELILLSPPLLLDAVGRDREAVGNINSGDTRDMPLVVKDPYQSTMPFGNSYVRTYSAGRWKLKLHCHTVRKLIIWYLIRKIELNLIFLCNENWNLRSVLGQTIGMDRGERWKTFRQMKDFNFALVQKLIMVSRRNFIFSFIYEGSLISLVKNLLIISFF